MDSKLRVILHHLSILCKYPIAFLRDGSNGISHGVTSLIQHALTHLVWVTVKMCRLGLIEVKQSSQFVDTVAATHLRPKREGVRLGCDL